MSAEGLEPSTNSLKGYCSAIELRARFFRAECILSRDYISVNVSGLSQSRKTINANTANGANFKNLFVQFTNSQNIVLAEYSHLKL